MFTLEDAIKQTKLFVCDMDGTVYLGNKPLNGAIDFVKTAHACGKEIIFFTNNASKAKSEYIVKLNRLGFEACPVVTAGDVAINYLLNHRKNKTIFSVCTESLKNDMLNAGLNIVNDPLADIVLSSFDTELTYNKVHKACDCIRNGAEFFCTHPDLNCPLENGWLPDSGAIAAMITAATGVKPIYFGKPYAPAAEMILEISGTPREKVMCIGDRLYTDIALGKNAGLKTLLVLSGESKRSDVNNDNKPDYITESVMDIIPYLEKNNE